MLRLSHPQSYLLLCIEKKGRGNETEIGNTLKEDKRTKSRGFMSREMRNRCIWFYRADVVRIILRISRLVSRLKLFFFFNTRCDAFDYRNHTKHRTRKPSWIYTCTVAILEKPMSYCKINYICYVHIDRTCSYVMHFCEQSHIPTLWYRAAR